MRSRWWLETLWAWFLAFLGVFVMLFSLPYTVTGWYLYPSVVGFAGNSVLGGVLLLIGFLILMKAATNMTVIRYLKQVGKL